MVDFQTIQEAYYMVAATGVIVAAIFYMLNLRETTRNRRITLTTTLMEPFSTKEGQRDFLELVSMEWSDLEDFTKRFDSRVNPENYALRASMWIKCDKLGQLYDDGLLDLRTLDVGSGSVIQYMWTKFKPVIEMYRSTDFTPSAYRDFESVAEKLIEYDRVKGDLEKGRLGRIMQEQADAMHAKTP